MVAFNGTRNWAAKSRLSTLSRAAIIWQLKSKKTKLICLDYYIIITLSFQLLNLHQEIYWVLLPSIHSRLIIKSRFFKSTHHEHWISDMLGRYNCSFQRLFTWQCQQSCKRRGEHSLSRWSYEHKTRFHRDSWHVLSLFFLVSGYYLKV